MRRTFGREVHARKGRRQHNFWTSFALPSDCRVLGTVSCCALRPTEPLMPYPPPKERELLPMVRPPHGGYAFPPLVLHGDPLATSLVLRTKAGTLSPDTLRAALVLNATRMATLVNSWFPEGGSIKRDDFLDMLGAIGLSKRWHRHRRPPPLRRSGLAGGAASLRLWLGSEGDSSGGRQL